MESAIFRNTDDDLTATEKILKRKILEAVLIGLPTRLKQRSAEESIGSNIRFLLNQKAETSCWFYNIKRKTHYIVLSNAFHYEDQNNVMRKRLSCSFFDHILHEYGHALFSAIELKEINDMLSDNETPFDIFNIFEDIRIENLVSRYFLSNQTLTEFTKDTLFKIDKVNNTDSLWEVLIKILGTQGRVEPEAFSNPYYLELKDYKERVFQAKDSFEVAEISVEFYKKYKKMLDPFIQNCKNKSNENQESKTNENKTGSKEKSAFDKIMEEEDTEERENTPGEKKQKNGNNGFSETSDNNDTKNGTKDLTIMDAVQQEQLISESIEISIAAPDTQKKELRITIDEENATEYLPEHKYSVEDESNSYKLIDLTTKNIPEVDLLFTQEAEKAYRTFLKLLSPEEISTPSYDDGDIDIDNIIGLGTLTDVENPLFNKTQIKRTKISSIHIIYDSSGSMYGSPDRTSKELLFAINEMARASLMDAKLTISKVIEDKAFFQTVELPINYKSIFTIKTNGWAEGLANATKASALEGANAKDIILYFTDGFLSDEDTEALKDFFTKHPSFFRKSIAVSMNSLGDKNLQNIFNNRVVSHSDAPAMATLIYDIVSGNSAMQGQGIGTQQNRKFSRK